MDDTIDCMLLMERQLWKVCEFDIVNFISDRNQTTVIPEDLLLYNRASAGPLKQFGKYHKELFIL